MTANELIARALDPSAAPAERDAALRGLVLTVQAIARDVAALFAGQVRNDLLDEAVSHVLARLDRFDPAAQFRPWAVTVLYNRGCDLRRRRGRRTDPLSKARTSDAEGRDGTDGVAAPAGPDASLTAGRLREGFEAVRAALDGASWPPPTGLDTFAVFLMYLRLRLATEVLRALPGEAAPGHVADCLEGWLAWHPPEQQRRFRTGWEVLNLCWHAVRPLLDAGPPAVAAVCDALAPLSGEAGLTVSVWNQWVNRARRAAQDHVAADDWGLFARWVPNRAARPEAAP